MSKKPYKILVIDDEQALADTLILTLDEDCFQAKCCYEAKEAIALLQADSFDVVLSDVKMPDMDGLEFLKKVKGELQLPVPIFVMTGFADYPSEDLIATGAIKVFKKPDDINIMQSSILNYLSKDD